VLGQETTGPGGLAYALRGVPVMLEMAREVKRLAPDAFVMNFTNPAGIVTEAMQTVLGDRVLGICDTPSGLGRRVAGVMGVDPMSVQMDYVGLNHLGWMRRVMYRGQDLMPSLMADDAKLSQLEEGQVFGTEWIHALGTIPQRVLVLLLLQPGRGHLDHRLGRDPRRLPAAVPDPSSTTPPTAWRRTSPPTGGRPSIAGLRPTWPRPRAAPRSSPRDGSRWSSTRPTRGTRVWHWA
jgi:hypothetical protein